MSSMNSTWRSMICKPAKSTSTSRRSRRRREDTSSFDSAATLRASTSATILVATRVAHGRNASAYACIIRGRSSGSTCSASFPTLDASASSARPYRFSAWVACRRGRTTLEAASTLPVNILAIYEVERPTLLVVDRDVAVSRPALVVYEPDYLTGHFHEFAVYVMVVT